MGVLSTIKAGVAPLGTKAVDEPRFPAFAPYASDWSWTPGIRQIQGQVGTGLGNSAVFACASVIMDAIIEPTWRHFDADGEPVDGSPVVEVLENPNPDIDELTMRAARILSLHLNGNAYTLRVVNRLGRVVQLWPLMPHMVTPKSDNRARLVTHYEYRVDGEVLRIDAADVIHTRYGTDPKNPAAGLSAFQAMLRDIYTDQQAARYASAVLTNLGMPGVVIRPPDDGSVTISDPTARRLRRKWRDRFSVDNAGTPLVLSEPVQVERFALSPSDMDWSAMRRIPETRIAAVMRVPAILAGLAAGIEMSSGRSETSELMKFYTRNRVVPLWRLDATQMSRQLLPGFGLPARHRVGYDLSRVWALQEETDKRWERVTKAFSSGLLTVATAQTELGFDPDPGGDYYLQPAGAVPQLHGETPALETFDAPEFD